MTEGNSELGLLGNMVGTKVGNSLNAVLEQKPFTSYSNEGIDSAIPDIPNTNININDPKWSRDLNEIASKQRQALNIQAKKSSHNYLLDANKQDRYRSTLFGSSSQSLASSSNRRTVLTVPNRGRVQSLVAEIEVLLPMKQGSVLLMLRNLVGNLLKLVLGLALRVLRGFLVE